MIVQEEELTYLKASAENLVCSMINGLHECNVWISRRL
jgi:hypothetical protein